MRVPGSLEQVVLVPRNGLGNRLQAWASAAILAAQWDVPLKVMWEPEPPAPAEADVLFTPEARHSSFVSRGWLDNLLGCAHENLPRYLTVLDSRRTVILAGHDRGEHVFMADLPSALSDASQPHSLVIIAGGLFHVPSTEDFVLQRTHFYRALPWHQALLTCAQAQIDLQAPYCALHIRQTDRSVEAPSRRTIRLGLKSLARSVPERGLFIAADTSEGREVWAQHARQLGFAPWHSGEITFDRTDAAGTVNAAMDWILLSRATALAYPAASTFSAEAAVASGSIAISISMKATQRLQQTRMWRMHGHNALTYPARRHWRR